MKFVCFSNWSELPDSANQLFDQGAKENMSFSRPWFENLADTALKPGQSMLLACVTDGDTMLAILPLIQQSDGQWESLSHSYSTHYTILLQGHEKSRILACLASGLSQLPFKTLRLKPFDENDQKVQGLQQAMENLGISCHQGFRFYNWSYSLQGQSFEQYMAKRPGRVRNTIARKERKLKREHGYEIRLITDQQLPQAMADYNLVYKASWKATEVSYPIMQSLIERFAQLGWLRLAVLYVQDQPVAAQIWFVVQSKASIFRLVYDQSWKQYSPGSIVTKFLMEYVIDTDKVDKIDFLTGNERYKQDWMSQRNARWEMVCANTCKSRSKSGQFIGHLKDLLKIN